MRKSVIQSTEKRGRLPVTSDPRSVLSHLVTHINKRKSLCDSERLSSKSHNDVVFMKKDFSFKVFVLLQLVDLWICFILRSLCSHVIDLLVIY